MGETFEVPLPAVACRTTTDGDGVPVRMLGRRPGLSRTVFPDLLSILFGEEEALVGDLDLQLRAQDNFVEGREERGPSWVGDWTFNCPPWYGAGGILLGGGRLEKSASHAAIVTLAVTIWLV